MPWSRWPDAIAVEIQRQSGSQVASLFDGTVSKNPTDTF